MSEPVRSEPVQSKPVHPVDEILPLPKLFALGLQHVLVMYANAVAVPLIIGGALHLPKCFLALGSPEIGLWGAYGEQAAKNSLAARLRLFSHFRQNAPGTGAKAVSQGIGNALGIVFADVLYQCGGSFLGFAPGDEIRRHAAFVVGVGSEPTFA